MTGGLDQTPAPPAATPAPEEPSGRNRLLQIFAPERIDWRSVVLVPLLAVFSALIVGAIIIALTEGPGDI